MAISKDEATEVDAISIRGIGFIFAGVGLPSDEVADAPLGAFYLRENGQRFYNNDGLQLPESWDQDSNAGGNLGFCVPVFLEDNSLVHVHLSNGFVPVELEDGTFLNVELSEC